MQENDKKIIIRVMNIIALIGNIGTLLLLTMMTFLSKYVEEFSEIFKNFDNGNVLSLSLCIRIGLCIIFSIINLFLSKNMKKNDSKISLLMAISLLLGSIYSIISSFVSIIIIYKNKKRRKNRWKYKVRWCKINK